MRIMITAGGLYGKGGKPIPIGTELTVKEMPIGWASRCQIISSGGKGKVAVANPVGGGAKGYAVADKGNGWFVITNDGQEVSKSLRANEVKGFDDLSDEDKAAFVDLHKAEA